MNTTEKLNKIRAKCVELLAIAEKRTSEKWETDIQAKCPSVFTESGEFIALYCKPNDSTYIASCAGAAEAGWKATIAAIDSLIKERDSRAPFSEDAGNGLSLILAAWEGIL